MKDNCTLFAPPSLYAAARLYSVAMGQIPRSTERISSSYDKNSVFENWRAIKNLEVN